MPSEFDNLDHDLMSEERRDRSRLSYLLWFVGGVFVVFIFFFVGLWYAYHHKTEIESKNSVPLLRPEGPLKEAPVQKGQDSNLSSKNMEVFNRLKQQDDDNMKKIEQILPPEAKVPLQNGAQNSAAMPNGQKPQASGKAAPVTAPTSSANGIVLPQGDKGIKAVPTPDASSTVQKKDQGADTAQAKPTQATSEGQKSTTQADTHVKSDAGDINKATSKAQKQAPASISVKKSSSADAKSAAKGEHAQGKDSLKAGKDDALVKLFDTLQDEPKASGGAKSQKAQVSSHTKVWQAQVGVTRDQDHGRALFKKWVESYPDLFKGRELHFEKIPSSGGGVLYRMRIVPFRDYDDAKTFCSKVSGYKIACLAMADEEK